MSEISLKNFKIYSEIIEEESFEEFIANRKDSCSKFYSMKLKKFPNDYLLHSNKIDNYVADCSDRILESIPIDVDYAGTYFILFELLNNVFKHSLFDNAYVLCRMASDEDIAEICIFDDGAGISNTLAENNVSFRNDSEAIFKAINGATSDKEKDKLKGRGLNTSANIISMGFDEELLIASKKGLVTVDKHGVDCHEDMDSFLYGTLICLRINTKKFNIYNYLKWREHKRL